MNPYRRSFAAWMACLAVLLAALAPAISHGINAFRLADAGMHHHCDEPGDSAKQAFDTEGSAMPAPHRQAPEDAGQAFDHAVSDNAAHAGHGSGADLHFEHCPFCFTHAGSFGLVPAIFFTGQMGMSVALRPALFYLSPHPLFAWTSAQPRAPPAVS